jgi:tetratricopeptide (TPR) repeat protein
VVEALRGLTRELGADRVRALLTGPRSELSRLLPQTDGGRVSHGDEPASQSRLFEAVLSTLETLGQERPVVLAIEDLHWADRSTLDLLAFIARNLHRARVLVVATPGRRDPPPPQPHPRARRAVPVALGRASRPRPVRPWGAHRAAGRHPRQGAGDRPRRRHRARSEGNAFYAEELLAAAERAGGQLPSTLRDILVNRLATLPETAKEVLRIAAAAARSVDHRLLEEVADLPASALRDGLREAVAHQALVTTEDGRSYRFRHALLQEAVHEELLPGERSQLHAAFAEALTRDPSLAAGGPDGVHAELAHHWYAAHELGRAFTASLAPAETAKGQYAFAEARHHYELALELWVQVAEDARVAAPPRYEVLRRAGQAAGLAGDARRSVSHLREALVAAGEDTPPAVRARLLGTISRMLWIAGDGTEALAVSEESVRAMPEEPSRDRAYALAWSGRLLMLSARYEEALGPSREAVEVARTVGVPLEESQALNSLGTSLAYSHDLNEGVALLRASLALALEAGGVDDVLRAHLNLGDVLSATARRGIGSTTVEDSRTWDKSIAVSEEGLGWADEHGVVGLVVDFLRLNLIDDLGFAGRWDDAERHIDGRWVTQPSVTDRAATAGGAACARAQGGACPDVGRSQHGGPLGG